MADDVIKNPLRDVPKTQIPYEPEHVRKGISVQPGPAVLGSRPIVKPISADTTIENTESFFSLDKDVLDDDGNVIPFDNGHVIDNNDFVNIGYDSTPRRDRAEVPPVAANAPVENAPTAPQVGDYILMVMGKLVTSGDMEKIQARVKNIVYGDDPTFATLEISMDDIVVLKRVNIKVGIFIDG